MRKPQHGSRVVQPSPLLPLLLTVLLTACDLPNPIAIALSAPSTGDCFPFCTDFGTKPGPEVRVVCGDTIRVLSFSDRSIDAAATWSVTGGAIRFTANDGSLLEAIGAPTTTVLVRAIEAGVAQVTARAGTHSATPRFTVTDSSAITSVQIFAGSNQLSVGFSPPVFTYLRDAAQRNYDTFPMFTVSDTSRVRLERRVDYALYGVHYVAVGTAPGNVRIIASFLNLSDTLDLTVIP